MMLVFKTTEQKKVKIKVQSQDFVNAQKLVSEVKEISKKEEYF